MTQAIPRFLNEYINQLTSEFEIKEIWLFGSRANNREKEDSDWDLFVFADPQVLAALKARMDLKSKDIDLMIVYDGNNFEQPWTSLSKDGLERVKNGQLMGPLWAFRKINDETAEYWGSIVDEEPVGDQTVKSLQYCTFKMYRIWDKSEKMENFSRVE